ncbi:MAG: phosphoribosyltransferase family protein [Nitrososphaerota archaeon]
MSGATIEYSGQKSYKVRLGNTARELPVVRVSENIWIASDAEVILGDVEFIEAAARMLADRVREYVPEVILTAEAKALALAYEVAKQLGHSEMIVARKSIKAYMTDYISEECISITTREKQTLVLARESAEKLVGKRVCILDDVVSTGGTINALEKLAMRAGGKVVCRAAIWLEGPWYSGKLIYLDRLPIFLRDQRQLPKARSN